MQRLCLFWVFFPNATGGSLSSTQLSVKSQLCVMEKTQADCGNVACME